MEMQKIVRFMLVDRVHCFSHFQRGEVGSGLRERVMLKGCVLLVVTTNWRATVTSSRLCQATDIPFKMLRLFVCWRNH